MNEVQKAFADLMKATEAGSYDAKPSSLVNGAALGREELATVIENVCEMDEDVLIQKYFGSKAGKSNTWEFTRQLSYGSYGGSAVMEGQIGRENTSKFARVAVPMAYYVDLRRVTEQSLLIDTVDGKKSDDRAAEDAAEKLAGDVEFHFLHGADDFSNGGVFDGNPDVMPRFMPGAVGLSTQIRQSDAQKSAQDSMFNEFGGSESVVFSVGGTLTQSAIEDARARSKMNHGKAKDLLIDPLVHSTYNKITQGKERLILAGSPQEATGASLNRQWTANGEVNLVPSRFNSGKTNPNDFLASCGPSAGVSATSTTTSGVVTPFLINQTYQYYVTSTNEAGGESAKATASVTIAASSDEVVLVIQPPGSLVTQRQYLVYRSANGGSQASAKYIGRIKSAASGNTTFHDMGQKTPGFVTGILIEKEQGEIRELSPFTRKVMPMNELTHPEIFYRFCTLVVKQPRKMCVLDSLSS